MTTRASLSHHLDLYRYWQAKRGSGVPTRRDLDPTDIPRLLPHLALIQAVGGGYRWRVMGSQIVDDMGCDLTNQPFGGHVRPLWFVGAMTATFDRVLGEGQPVFEGSVYTTADDRTHAVSRLLLPLAASSGTPPMVLLTRITRRRPLDRPANYIRAASGTITGTCDVGSPEELERRVTLWESGTVPPVASIAPQPVRRIANLWDGGLPQIVWCGAARKTRPVPSAVPR